MIQIMNYYKINLYKMIREEGELDKEEKFFREMMIFQKK
jgi:hypothetical protein